LNSLNVDDSALLPLLGLIVDYDGVVDGGIGPEQCADSDDQDCVATEGHEKA
jgi:hypothetical protein